MRISKAIGNRVFVSEEMKNAALAIAEEINASATTGSGTTEIKKIMNPELRDLMEFLEKRILIKSTKKIDIPKLSKIVQVEESFYEELVKQPEVQAVANLKESLRFTYIRSILSKYGRPTKEEVWNVLSKVGVTAIDPGVDDTAILKELSSSDADFIKNLSAMYIAEKETREGKLAGGKPSVLINSACENLNKTFTKKGINAVAIAKPLKKDYVSRGLTKPYKGKKATDVLVVYTDKAGNIHDINLEYFGWTGISYERGIVNKGKEIADNFGHQYGVFSPSYADNEAALARYTKDLSDREGNFDEKVSDLEKKAYQWVLSNDKYVAPTVEDAIYEGFYGILDELGIAKKVMPVSKIALFKR